MKHICKIFFIGILLFSTNLNAQNVAINDDGALPDASAMLEVTSLEKGFLPPRMRTNMRNAIPSPSTGLMVYDTDTESYWYRGVSSWIEINNTKTAPWRVNLSGHTYNTSDRFVQICNNSNSGIIEEGVLGVRLDDPSTNDVQDILSIQRSTPGLGTSQNGIGGSIVFRNKISNNASGQAGRISALHENVTLGFTRSAMGFEVYGANPFVNYNRMYFNLEGLTIGANTPAASMLDVKGDIKLEGEVNNPETGSANLLPICYGNVKSDGVINTGSNNFSVNRTGVGTYYITINSHTYHYLTYLTTVTPTLLNVPRIAVTTSSSGDLIVRIFDIAGAPVDGYFNFVVHKP